MNTEGPTRGRLVVIAGFALTCFCLLLFLWLAFGGAIPLKPQGYRVQVSFTDAATLADQADVRTAGVRIGKVVKKELDPRGGRLLATIELDAKYAPLKADARAILRQKTLLGETYVEMSTGSRDAPDLKEGARLRNARVRQAVEFDELFSIFDEPTRRAFRQWQASAAKAGAGATSTTRSATCRSSPRTRRASSASSRTGAPRCATSSRTPGAPSSSSPPTRAP